MKWTAIVPVNFGRPCKTRLAEALSAEARDRLTTEMARHVLARLGDVPSIAVRCVLSPAPPPIPHDIWIEDRDRGLNDELEAARAGLPGGPVLFLHADLPLLTRDDIEAVLDAAGKMGAAIAPDQPGTGTNAIALADGRGFVPRFGPGSFARHRAELADAAIVRREGLASDLDQPEMLETLLARGVIASLDNPVIAPPI